MKFLSAEIFQSILAFFQSLRNSISLEHIMYIFIGLEILTIIIFAFIINSVYEVRLMRAIDKLNAYLYHVQYIDDSNLIEFNNRMKRVPKTLRYHWQQYMLYREKMPSHYMSIENCIDRPTKASAFDMNLKIAKILGTVYAILSFLLCCGWAAGLTTLNTDYFLTIVVIPLIILFFNYLLIIGLNIKKSTNTRDLYQTFFIFNRFIDKAVVTLPDYVDFEVLFTRKEIKKGIPVLNEYIERRQIQEQEEMRKAKENAVQHEMFNFDEADEKGELVLERAIKEAELLISLKNRLNAEIEQIEKEIESYKRSYENTSREYQRKMQASKENIERLREQQEATTNRIESNYIRKQQSDEIKKQQQIEKEQDDATLRFNQEINTLTEEINKRKTELEEAKKAIEKAMLAEYKTYADKVFAEVKDSVNKRFKEERDSLISTREIIARELEDALSKAEQLEKQNRLLVTKSSERDALIRAEVGKENEVLKQKIAELEELVEEKEQHIQIISDNPHIKTKKEIDAIKKVKKGKKPERIESQSPEDYFNEKKEKIEYKNIQNSEMEESQNVVINEVPKNLEVKKETQIEENDKSLNDVRNKKLNESQVKRSDETQIGKSDENQSENDAKSKSQGKEEVVKTEVEPPKRPRGRPRKIVTESTEPQPKRPRGRPRKIVTEPAEPQPKRPRGRPRKIVTEPIEPQPKRPRGRPRKVVAADGDGIQAEQKVADKITPTKNPKIDIDDLKVIEKKLKEQNDILKTQHAEFEDTIKKATKK